MDKLKAKQLLLTLEELAVSSDPRKDHIAFELIEKETNYQERYIYTKIYFFYEKILNEGVKE